MGREERLSVIDEVREERARQDEMWGGPDHDDQHSLQDWCGFIEERLYEIRRSGHAAVRRRKMLACAALAVACIEAVDRNTARLEPKP